MQRFVIIAVDIKNNIPYYLKHSLSASIDKPNDPNSQIVINNSVLLVRNIQNATIFEHQISIDQALAIGMQSIETQYENFIVCCSVLPNNFNI